MDTPDVNWIHACGVRANADAERVLRELTTAAGTSYVPPYHIALLHAGLGDTKAAISWLERGVQERDVRMVFVGVDPLWQPMHRVPEFRELLRRLKLDSAVRTSSTLKTIDHQDKGPERGLVGDF